MRKIETWARQPIQQLVAGSGVTLSNETATDSKGNGPFPITISASGGGGGKAPSGYLSIQSGPDSRAWDTGFINPLGGDFQFASSGGVLTGAYTTALQLWNDPGAAENSPPFSWNGSWMTFPGFSGSWAYAITEFPSLIGPVITAGGPIDVQVIIWASDLTYANYASYGTNKSFTDLEAYTFQISDFTLIASTGTDLSLNAGTGSGPTDFGNGIVSGGAVNPYLGGVTIWVDSIPAGTTFD
jgi:hypothetical protein